MYTPCRSAEDQIKNQYFFLSSTMHLVTVEIFPALPYNWTASEVEPSVRHATYLQRLKLKFDCSHCRRGKTRWTSMKVHYIYEETNQLTLTRGLQNSRYGGKEDRISFFATHMNNNTNAAQHGKLEKCTKRSLRI